MVVAQPDDTPYMFIAVTSATSDVSLREPMMPRKPHVQPRGPSSESPRDGTWTAALWAVVMQLL